MMRTHYCGTLTETQIDQTVTLCGWVHRRRDHGGVIFLDMRDRDGLVQVVIDPDTPEAFSTADKVRSEFVLKITGRVRDRDQRIVERRRDMDNSHRNILFLFLLKSFLLRCYFCHDLVCFPITQCAAISQPHTIRRLFLARSLFLRNGCFSRPFTCSRICTGALSANRQSASMTQSAITSDIHQSLDIHLDPFSQVAFDITFGIENGSDLI